MPPRMLCLFLLCLAWCALPSAAQPAPLSQPHFAPYALMGGPAAYGLAQLATQENIPYVSLGFMLSNPQHCEALWNGSTRVDDVFLMRSLAGLRAAGGDIIVSFGGAAGGDLAMICPDVASLRAEYQRVITLLDVRHLDFDIEGDDIQDEAALRRRFAATAQMQAEAKAQGRPLWITLTLPTATTGLTREGLAVVSEALAAGVALDVVNIMTMNFGDDAPPDAMGDNVIAAAESLHAQLSALYPDKSADAVWRMIGLTPMLGVNDVQFEVFSLEDAAQVTAFARDKGVRRLAMWSLERDKSCVSGVRALLPNCSGIQQDALAFSRIFQSVGDVGR